MPLCGCGVAAGGIHERLVVKIGPLAAPEKETFPLHAELQGQLQAPAGPVFEPMDDRTSNEQLQDKVDELLAGKQQFELALATARSFDTAQEQLVVNMSERFNAPAPRPGPDLAPKNPAEGASRSAQSESKKPTPAPL